MWQVNQARYVPCRAISRVRNVDTGRQLRILINRDALPGSRGRRVDVEDAVAIATTTRGSMQVGSSVGAGKYDGQCGTTRGLQCVIGIELPVFNDENRSSCGSIDCYVAGKLQVPADDRIAARQALVPDHRLLAGSGGSFFFWGVLADTNCRDWREYCSPDTRMGPQPPELSNTAARRSRRYPR